MTSAANHVTTPRTHSAPRLYTSTHTHCDSSSTGTGSGGGGRFLPPPTLFFCQDTHTHPFNGPFSRTTRVGRYQKGKTNLDFTEARDSEWQWHQMGHMQVCTSLQTDNHASTSPLSFLQAGCPSCRPTNSVKALKAGQWKETVKTVKNRQKLQTSFTRFNITFILVAALFLASFTPLLALQLN